MENTYHYYAFISYATCDSKWAKWLQHQLSYYHIPSAVRKGKIGVPEKIRPIFIYEYDLAGNQLHQAIEQELSASKYLILICSPSAAKSKYVNCEVETFIKQGRQKYIIPFIVEGKVNASNPDEECFPPALLELMQGGNMELRGANIATNGKHQALVDVVATMLGVRRDLLWNRYKTKGAIDGAIDGAIGGSVGAALGAGVGAGAAIGRAASAVAGAGVGAAIGRAAGAVAGVIIGTAVSFYGFKSSSSDETRKKQQENLLEKELEAELAQAQMCKKQIEEFKQYKSNLEKEPAVLEEQNKYNEVYSSIFAPAEVKRKSHLQVQVYLHLYEESETVKSLAKESDKNAERRDYIPLSLKLKKGDKVDVEFNVYGETRLMSERKYIIWQGSFTKCSFNYFVPKYIDVDELSCEANLFVNGAMIGEMRFLTQIVEAPRNLNSEILSHRFNRIFISYAHQDAQQIKLLALAYKAQGVDYFYDRDSLAPGDIYEEKIFDYIDSSDLFVLCWSKNAAVSDYVAKEKGRALLRAYPQLSQREATLKICPISIEPRADLPSDMKEVYNFEVI